MREVECRISKVILNEHQEGQVIWIKEAEGERSFAVIVGFFEANSLRDRIRELRPPRPLTHNLIVNCIKDLGGRLVKVVITELKQNTYFANLVVEQNGRTVAIDARPSDGLVLCMQEKVPLFVSEEVLAEASKWSLEPHLAIALEESDEDFEAFLDSSEFDEDDDDDDYDEDDDEDGNFEEDSGY